MSTGTLYLVPSLLGDTAPAIALPAHSIVVAQRLEHYVAENAKPARAFLKAIGVPRPVSEIAITEIGEAPSPQRCHALLAPARGGHDLGLLSDAGCPGVADPGARLVAAAHDEHIPVVPLVGPSSLLLALMASGMNGQGFAFHGYLPVAPAARVAALRRLEADSARTGHAQLFIETPYRNAAMLEAIASHCKATTRLCVAVDLTMAGQQIVSKPVGEWRGADATRYHKRPAVFILQAG
jgi:16S rRNA (cytidine1402-2'-O)-methyltransferase